MTNPTAIRPGVLRPLQHLLACGYAPDDWVGLLSRSSTSGRVSQHVRPVAWVLTRRVQFWLATLDRQGWHHYIGVNAFVAGQRSRRRTAVSAVRHVMLDVDHQVGESLAGIAHQGLPQPSYVIRVTMADDGVADLRGAALAFGFALIAAALVGRVFERLRLPRISGYLFFGLACGPYVGDLISRSMAADLQLVNGLAIALIAFIAGLEINFARIRERLGSILLVGASVIVITFTLLAATLYVLWPWLPIAPDATGIARVAMTLVVTTVLVSFSPTVTIAVIAESRARGPLTELALAVVVLADLALILTFTLVMQWMRTISGLDAGVTVGIIPYLSWDILGSLAFGAIVGALFAFYLSRVSRELTLVLLALCVLVSAAGSVWHFEPLLSALAAGLVVENIAPPSGDALKLAVERGALPVLIVFFAAAGASLQVDALARVGLVAIGVSLLRMVGVWLGTRVGLRRAGLADQPMPMLWMALVSQAGVTLGLTIIVASEFPDWGGRVQTLMVALIAIHELIGPILFRSALVRAGEVGKM